MIDVSVLRLLLLAITGWLDRRERKARAYLIEENRFLRRRVGPLRRVLILADAQQMTVFDENGMRAGKRTGFPGVNSAPSLVD